MSDLIKLDNISKRNGHIRAYPINHNLKRMNIGANGWGEVVIAVDNQIVRQLMESDWVGGLFITTKEEWEKEVEDER